MEVFSELMDEDLSDDQFKVKDDSESILSDLSWSDDESDDEFISLKKLKNGDYKDESLWIKEDKLPNLEDFLGESGIKIYPDNPCSIKDCVKLFIDDELIKSMCEHSNSYYKEVICSTASKVKQLLFYDITPAEMEKFIGLVILMSQVRKDNLKDYWSTDPLWHTPIFGKVMSRDRFGQIWKSWNFNDNLSINDESKRRHKIIPILNHFQNRFMKVFYPNRDLLHDEFMIPYGGRLRFQPYNSLKLGNYAMLVRMIVDSDTGYICNIDINCGEGRGLEGSYPEVLEPFLNSWHHVFQTNYLNCISTTKHLLDQKTRICSNMRRGYVVPLQLASEVCFLNHGESAYYRNGDILIQAWRSAKISYMISTIHDAKNVNIFKKKNEKGGFSNLFKPNCMVQHKTLTESLTNNKHYLSQCGISTRSNTWVRKVVLFLINCAIFNAYKIHSALNSPNLQYQLFLREVTRFLINDESCVNTSLIKIEAEESVYDDDSGLSKKTKLKSTTKQPAKCKKKKTI